MTPGSAVAEARETRATGDTPQARRALRPARAWLYLLGVSALALCLCGFSPFDPGWTACDRLDTHRGVPAAAGLWVRAGLTSWEAVPNGLEARVGAGLEPRQGFGLRVECRSLNWNQGNAQDGTAGVVWRSSRWRNELALGQSRFAGHHATRCTERLLIAISPQWVAGGSLTFFPAAPRGSPEFEVETHAATGPWLLGLVLRESAAEASAGIEARPHLFVIVRYRDDVPGLGIVLETHGVELRAEAEDHPALGRKAWVSLQWKLGGP